MEKNYSSMRKKGIYREEFWKLVNHNSSIIYGCDAHSTNEMIIADLENSMFLFANQDK